MNNHQCKLVDKLTGKVISIPPMRKLNLISSAEMVNIEICLSTQIHDCNNILLYTGDQVSWNGFTGIVTLFDRQFGIIVANTVFIAFASMVEEFIMKEITCKDLKNWLAWLPEDTTCRIAEIDGPSPDGDKISWDHPIDGVFYSDSDGIGYICFNVRG